MKPDRASRHASKHTAIDQTVEAYLMAHQPPEHPELCALRERTKKLPHGYMQISPVQGHLLAMLIRLAGVRRCIEIGTFTGYSALAMALALPDDGHLVACDTSKTWTSIGREHWRRTGIDSKIDLRIAPALDTLMQLDRESGPDQFDLAFIDADKTGYDAYYEVTLRLVRTGGLIILDNTLRRGRVAQAQDIEPDTVALRQLNAKIGADDRVDFVLLPIASGMTLARRR